jgi:hypothetical protein
VSVRNGAVNISSDRQTGHATTVGIALICFGNLCFGNLACHCPCRRGEGKIVEG